jgi:uncharacterized iron-regulated membrane protein
MRVPSLFKPKFKSSKGSTLRAMALWVHRYVGLATAAFLAVAGVTGTVLVFAEELDSAINSTIMRVDAEGQAAEPFEVARRVQAIQPNEPAWEVNFAARPGHAVEVWHEVSEDRYRQRFVNPYTGAILGDREWGNIGEGVVNLIPFIYRLHYSLALGEVGVFLFGLVALLWTLDTFVGAYLTFPTPGPARARRGAAVWLKRWLPAWLLKTNRLFSGVFTWHRASGLWLWGLLLVFAWSSVGLNLSDVYRPIMRATFGLTEHVHTALPEVPKPYSPAAFSMEQAHVQAKQYMAAELARHGAELRRERTLAYTPEHGAIVYTVESSLDLSSRHPHTQVFFDAQSGAVLGFQAPTGQTPGDTITSWLYALHFASIGGLPYRLLVAAIGLLVALLSATGVWIWLRKRQKRARAVSELTNSLSPAAQLETLR